MSANPYATRKGVRIRKRYNESVIRYRNWQRAHEPTGATGTDWLLWKGWAQARYDAMLSDRNEMIADYTRQQKRSKRNGRNPERSDRAAASAADH